jgi:hypothetical protein
MLKGFVKITEKNLHIIFIGSLFLIYSGIYLYYGDALFVASGLQDWNYVHHDDTRSNWDIWKNDIGGTIGVKNYHLVSMSYWLPIFISDLTGIPTIFLFRLQVLLFHPSVVYIFYKITSLVYKNNWDRVLPCVLLALGSWNIFRVSLTGEGFHLFFGYYAQDFFIFFLLALYFFLKKAVKITGLFIFFGILIHPAMGVPVGGFLIMAWWFIFKDSKLYPFITLMAFAIAGVATELILLKIVFPPDIPIVEPEIIWDIIMNHGHMNLFHTHQLIFFQFSVVIFFLATCSYNICEHKIIKKLILLGGGWLVLMFLVYLTGYLGKIPDIMRLQALRFSNSFLFIIFLGVQYPKTRAKGMVFVFFVAMLFGVHSLLSPWPAKELIIPKLPAVFTIVMITGIVLLMLFIRKLSVNFKKHHIDGIRASFIIFLIGITLASPVIRWSRAVDNRVLRIEEAMSFAASNLKGNKIFLLWGQQDQMLGEIFRTVTHSPTLKLHRQGVMWVNDGSKTVYDDEVRRISIFFDDMPNLISERRRKTNKAMQGTFTKQYSNFYKNEFGVTHIVIFSSPDKSIDSVGELLFDNNLIQIRAL